MKVRVDPELCVGTGECVRLAADAFHFDEARGVSTVQPGAATTDRGLLEEVAFACPTRAITVEDEA